jgi:hypothetical protein
MSTRKRPPGATCTSCSRILRREELDRRAVQPNAIGLLVVRVAPVLAPRVEQIEVRPSVALGHPHRAARPREDVELLLIDDAMSMTYRVARSYAVSPGSA